MPESRIALITGGAGGIGLSIARRLTSCGIRVVVAERDEAAAQRAIANDVDVTILQVDVAQESSVSALFAAFDARFPRLDMLINCAGVSPRVLGARPTVELTPLEIWEQTIAVNLTGTFLMCRSAVPRMRANRWGRIVNLASIAARTLTEASSSYYAASKSGVIGFSRVLAGEVGREGITVNCVSPSRITTAMTRNAKNAAEMDELYLRRTPIGRLGQPTDVAAAVAYLTSEEAGFVTGAILDVTGGYFMS